MEWSTSFSQGLHPHDECKKPACRPSYDRVQEALRKGAREAKPDEWVLAREFDPNRIEGARSPTLAEHDELVPNNPFFKLEGKGHVAYANTAAACASTTRALPR
ncbi:MAG: amidohydrolase family protein [Burkholderiaceae bacterium]